MAYTKDDYIKDLYIVEHTNDSYERSEANERPLVKEIHDEAARGYQFEKAMYQNPMDNYLKIKKDRNCSEDNLLKLMTKYKEEYYDKRGGRNTDGGSGKGCVIALVVIVCLVIAFLRGCFG